MALTQPWLGLIALLLVLASLPLAWLQQRRRAAHGAPISGAARLRSLPRFRQLARRAARLQLARVAGLTVALLGACLLVAQPVSLGSSPQEQSNRDIVLCLDVSGSMAEVDKDVIDSYLQLASQLDGERIGFVMFDASAITVFPLTDDADYITEQLMASRDLLDGRVLPGTQIGDGTSLIADGLVSCLSRFDVPEQDRSRTLVLATDNQAAGAQLYTLEAATTKAKDAGVLVYGVVPSDNTPRVTEALTKQLRKTGGDTLLLGPNTDVSTISDAVERQERKALATPARATGQPMVWPGALAMLIGAVVAGVAWLAGRQS